MSAIARCIRLAFGFQKLRVSFLSSFSTSKSPPPVVIGTAGKYIRAFEELQTLLLQASRNQSKAPIESMKLKIVAAVDAMDRSLVKFVPSEVLDKAKAVANAYFVPEEYLEPEKLDPQLKKLELIL